MNELFEVEWQGPEGLDNGMCGVVGEEGVRELVMELGPQYRIWVDGVVVQEPVEFFQ